MQAAGRLLCWGLKVVRPVKGKQGRVQDRAGPARQRAQPQLPTHLPACLPSCQPLHHLSTPPPAGDTPRGMVESAFEFADICRDMDYHNFLFSMKARFLLCSLCLMGTPAFGSCLALHYSLV